MARIYIAYTGGTIGMRPTRKGFAPAKGHLAEAIAIQPEFKHHALPEFVIHEYDELIDSSNMTPANWNAIARDIQCHYDDYDGFVILHGTDTMAYTASALSFMLNGLKKPVIITGSQIPFAELRSDARANLIGAMLLAARKDLPEVCLYFGNTLYRGNRSSKLDASGFSAFDSPNYPSLGEMGIRLRLNKQYILPTPEEAFGVSEVSDVAIGTVHLFPGISSKVIENTLQQPVRGLVILTYGAGNIPSQDKTLVELIRQACERDIAIVNCTQCAKGRVDMTGYETGMVLKECGVIDAHDMTIECTISKLSWLLSQEHDMSTVRQLMSDSLRGELTKTPQDT